MQRFVTSDPYPNFRIQIQCFLIHNTATDNYVCCYSYYYYYYYYTLQVDLVEKYGKLQFNLDYYTEVLDLDYFLDCLLLLLLFRWTWWKSMASCSSIWTTTQKSWTWIISSIVFLRTILPKNTAHSIRP